MIRSFENEIVFMIMRREIGIRNRILTSMRIRKCVRPTDRHAPVYPPVESSECETVTRDLPVAGGCTGCAGVNWSVLLLLGKQPPTAVSPRATCAPPGALRLHVTSYASYRARVACPLGR